MPIFKDEILEEAENKHYQFQMGCYFSDLKKISGAIIVWSAKIADFYWNYATKIDSNDTSKLIQQSTDFLKSKNRKPAVYLTPFSKPENLAKILEDKGFKLKFQDVWMFFEKDIPKINMPDNFVIKQVENKEEMRIFVNIFNQAYGGATPDEPYGELPKEYGECIFDSFINPTQDKKVIHYLGFLNNKPISIATLIYSENFGCIYNVGTIPQNRGKGFGSVLTLNAVKDSIKNNAKIVFLQTEKDSFNEKYFSKLGFSTKFIGNGYVLE